MFMPSIERHWRNNTKALNSDVKLGLSKACARNLDVLVSTKPKQQTADVMRLFQTAEIFTYLQREFSEAG